MSILSIHTGGSATKTSQYFWEQLQKQHFLSDGSLVGRDTFFLEKESGKYEMSAVFIDHYEELLPVVERLNIPFHSANFFFEPQTHIFPSYFYDTQSNKQHLLDTIRHQVECMDTMTGIMMGNSISGGVGSGAGSYLMTSLSETYPKKIIQSHQLIPDFSKYRHPDPITTHNAILTAHYSIQCPTMIMCYQNQCMEKILEQEKPNFLMDDVNRYWAGMITRISMPYRFGGSLNLSQAKIVHNLIPFPRLKLLIPSRSSATNINEYIESALEEKQQLTMRNTPDLQYLTMNLNITNDTQIYEGQANHRVNKYIDNRRSKKFTEWIPFHLQFSSTTIPKSQDPPSALVLGNTLHNINWVKQLCEEFTKPFRRKAFLHYYTEKGMDEMEFTEAESNCNDLVSEYTPCTCSGEVDDEYGEEEYY